MMPSSTVVTCRRRCGMKTNVRGWTWLSFNWPRPSRVERCVAPTSASSRSRSVYASVQPSRRATRTATSWPGPTYTPNWRWVVPPRWPTTTASTVVMGGLAKVRLTSRASFRCSTLSACAQHQLEMAARCLESTSTLLSPVSSSMYCL